MDRPTIQWVVEEAVEIIRKLGDCVVDDEGPPRPLLDARRRAEE